MDISLKYQVKAGSRLVCITNNLKLAEKAAKVSSRINREVKIYAGPVCIRSYYGK